MLILADFVYWIMSTTASDLAFKKASPGEALKNA